MDAVGERAELLDRDLELVGGRREQALELGVATLAQPPQRAAELEGERHEPLLGAVVEVALDPAPLLVRSGGDAGARLLDGRELGAHLRVQARVDEREPGRGRDRRHELRLVAQRRVVHEHGQRLPPVLDRRHRACLPVLRQGEGAARGVHVLAALG
jgi:hypothetical protein